MTVVKPHAMPQMGNVGQRLRVVQSEGQRRANPQVVTVLEQGAVDELRHPLCCFIVRETRIERVGTGADGDGDDARIQCCPRPGATCGTQ